MDDGGFVEVVVDGGGFVEVVVDDSAPADVVVVGPMVVVVVGNTTFFGGFNVLPGNFDTVGKSPTYCGSFTASAR